MESADKCCVGVSPLEDALLPNPDNCGTYIQCVHEKPMVRDCPAGLHWSPDACRCEWPSIAKCTTTDGSGTSTCRTATISNDCRYGKKSADECCLGVSPLEDVLLPNPNNCGTYLQCVHEKPMVRDCPDDLHWSPDACRCEWPSIAKCL
ncbi:obstructor-G [Carabus blaptoides fortunei]